jgi:hypothetical protein
MDKIIIEFHSEESSSYVTIHEGSTFINRIEASLENGKIVFNQKKHTVYPATKSYNVMVLIK